MALLNNDGRVKTVFYARVADPNTQTLAKRCRHVICTQAFFEGVTKVKIGPEDGNEVIVNAYQKLVDEVGKNNYIVIEDRYTAVKQALDKLESNDLLLILGKGHEEYIIIKDKKIPYNDRKAVNQIINEKELVSN